MKKQQTQEQQEDLNQWFHETAAEGKKSAAYKKLLTIKWRCDSWWRYLMIKILFKIAAHYNKNTKV